MTPKHTRLYFSFTVLPLTNMINICSWNARGVMYGSSFLIDHLENTDIFVICEHWLNDTNFDFLENLDHNFNVSGTVKYDNISRRGSGGVAIMTRKSKFSKIGKIRTNEIDNISAVCLSNTGAESMFVIGAILPSSNKTDQQYANSVMDLFAIYDQCYTQGTTIICGDLNSNISSDNNRSRILYQHLTERNTIHVANLQQRIGPPYTWTNKSQTSKTLIDYIAIRYNLINFITYCEIDNSCTYDVSDHLPCNTKHRYAYFRWIS